MLQRIDEKGGILLPAEYLQMLRIRVEDEIEITLHSNEIHLKKPIFFCVFCNGTLNLARVGSVCACRFCIERLYSTKSNMLYPLQVD